MKTRAFRCTTVLLAAFVVAAGPAPAQPADGEERAEALSTMAVTGSRLRGFFSDDAWPLTRISREELLDSGVHRLGDFLQELPFTSGSQLNTQTTRRGAGGGLSRGIETVELRGLGPERTLVLVNGRRFVPGGNGASGVVDVGMIPVAMVERIEVFKAGASVEYGADALAGVINIITRDAFNGTEASVKGSITSRGDAETLTVDAVAGRQFVRGGVVAGASLTDQAPVSKGDRGWSSTRLSFAGPDNRIVFDGSSAPPGGQYRTSFGRFTLIDGRGGDQLSDFRPFVDSGPNSDRFNFNPYEDLLQESRRLSVFARGHYDATPTLRLSAEAFVHQRDSSQQIAPLPFFTTREQDVVVAADNVFNPFGETLTDVRRRLVEAGPRRFSQDNRTWRMVLAADGFVGRWLWNASVAHGRNETDQVKTGDLLDSRLGPALGPSFRDADGNPVCGTPGDVVAGCVPLNVFGGPGSITPAMLDYVGTRLNDFGFNEQTLVNVNITGDAFELPAGPAAVAAGFEWREETGLDRPDPETRAGNTTGNARALTRGSFDAAEAYAEFGLPLLAGSAIGAVDLDLGARWVDYSNFGTDTVFEVGLGWQPTPSLSLRGAWSEAFRAPNVGELFGGQAESNPIVMDPCADFGPLSPVEIERCIAQGVPADGSFMQTGEETPERSGGNPALGPETADLLTLGFSWRPPMLDGVSVTLDYYDIEIENGIGSLGANTILDQCLATGAARFCDAIRRAPDGAIRFVQARLQNIARETARGVDLAIDWRHETDAGAFDHRLMLSRVGERALVAFPGSAPLFGAGGYDQDNFGAIPRWQGRYGLDLELGDWMLGYGAQWIGTVTERGGEVFPGTASDAGPVVYHDLFARWRASERWRLTAGIDNVTDIEPPFFANADEANTDLATYRALGTTFWLRVTFDG
ncbi:MAG: TonB-dependent receptor plug domain-containing protein [Candidatus Wenzhouxiangella sp. M2_3B_020]